MFDPPSTPKSSSRAGTWPRYMNPLPTSSHSSFPLDPALSAASESTASSASTSTSTSTTDSSRASSFHEPSILSGAASLPPSATIPHWSYTDSYNHTPLSAPLLPPPHQPINQYYTASGSQSSRHTLSPTSSASDSLRNEIDLKTPTARHFGSIPASQTSHLTPAIANAHVGNPTTGGSLHHSESSPSPMPFPPTPSPGYGISGSLIVSEPQVMLPTQEPSCNPMNPPSNDVFMSSGLNKGPARPVLRSTQSHNGAYNSPTPSFTSAWPRRLATSSESNERGRPLASSGSLLSGINTGGAAPAPPTLTPTTVLASSTSAAPFSRSDLSDQAGVGGVSGNMRAGSASTGANSSSGNLHNGGAGSASHITPVPGSLAHIQHEASLSSIASSVNGQGNNSHGHNNNGSVTAVAPTVNNGGGNGINNSNGNNNNTTAPTHVAHTHTHHSGGVHATHTHHHPNTMSSVSAATAHAFPPASSTSLPSVSTFTSYAAAPPPTTLLATHPHQHHHSIHNIHNHTSSTGASHQQHSHPPPPPPAPLVATGNHSQYHPHPHSHIHPHPYHHTQGTPSLDDLTLSSSPQYEASLPPFTSPWAAHSSLPNESHFGAISHPYHPAHYGYHPYYMSALKAKPEEPILQPGELPAPRPPNSYAALIGEALLSAPVPHQLFVAEISESIKRRYAYYRQNPSKVYNGVRHQTSMCKAFVKMPRPYGDQSGGARKWAIRNGCESWFHSGGYHPPPNATSPPSLKKTMSGKAKATARAKQLAIGTGSPEERHMRRLSHEPFSPSSGQGGPSVGPAFDGTGRPTYYQAPEPISPPASHTPTPSFLPHPHPGHGHAHSHSQPSYPYQLPAGYHYVPLPSHSHPHSSHYGSYPGGQSMMMPMFSGPGSYPPPSAPLPHGYPQQHLHGHPSSSPASYPLPTPMTSSSYALPPVPADAQGYDTSPEPKYEPDMYGRQPERDFSAAADGGVGQKHGQGQGQGQQENALGSPESMTSRTATGEASPVA